MRYDLVRENDQTGLVVSATEKYWGPNYLQFGLVSSNDFEGDSTVRFGVLYTRTAINSLNGEWRTGVQIGDETGLFTEIYQPLDPHSRYFTSGKVGYESRNVNVFDAAGNNLARYQLATYGLELGAGREFGTWGEGRLGYRRGSGTAEVTVGTPAPDLDVDLGEVFLRLADDKFDDLYFPRTGHIGRVELRVARDGLGASSDYDQVLLSYAQAFSWGNNTVIGQFAGATTLDDDAPLAGLFRAGGFLRLSGFAEDELSGQHFGEANLIYMRRLAAAQFFASYLGASLELGNVWQDSSDVSLDNTIFAGSVFLGLDTPIGPVYLAYGRTEQEDQAIYLYIGPRFSF